MGLSTYPTTTIGSIQINDAKDSLRHTDDKDGQCEGAPGHNANERQNNGHHEPFDVGTRSSEMSEPQERAESSHSRQVSLPASLAT
jgi:hypothetical protein